MLLKSIGNLWLGQGSAGPRSLFIAGEDGFVFDFTTPATLFQDAAGATPLAAAAQTIGLVCDKSRPRSPITAYAGVQASAGLRPTYGRAPKSRRQMLTNSEDFSAAYWTKAQATVTANALAAPDGTISADLVLPTAVTTNHGVYRPVTISGAGPWTISAYFKAQNGSKVALFSGAAGYGFDLAAGTKSAVGGITAAAAHGIEALTGGWWRCWITVNTAPTETTALILQSFASANWLGDGVTGVYLWGAQLEAGNLSGYQKATSAFDLTEAGYPAFGYARLDGADDKLTITLPAPITGDLMIFGRNGSWIESGVTLPSGSFDIGPTGTVLTPGVLAALGDLVGAVVIGRATTPTERALALRYFAARGAAGWLVAGADLVVNGGFATDTVWVKGAGWTIAAGVATHAAGVGSDIEQAGLLVLGQTYQVTLSVSAVRASSLLYVWDGVAYLEMASILTVGPKQAAFVAKATGALKIRLGAVADADIDNLSIKPLTVGA